MSRLGYSVAAGVAALLFWSSAAEAGLARATPSVIVIAASTSNTAVSDCADAECRNGPMAKAIAVALENPLITVAGLFDRINRSVSIATNRFQVPMITSSEPMDVGLRSPEGRSVALVIGNGTYTHLPHLAGAPRDAATVGKSLAGIGFEMKTLIDASPTAIDKELAMLLQGRGSKDTVVVYYAGGGFSVDGANYLATPDTDSSGGVDAAIGSSLPMSALLNRLEQSEAGKKILILDTQFVKAGPSMTR